MTQRETLEISELIEEIQKDPEFQEIPGINKNTFLKFVRNDIKIRTQEILRQSIRLRQNGEIERSNFYLENAEYLIKSMEIEDTGVLKLFQRVKNNGGSSETS